MYTAGVNEEVQYKNSLLNHHLLVDYLDQSNQAFDQLKKLSEQINVTILPKVDDQLPIDIAKRALQFAQLQEIDCLLFDTAGRINIDQSLMNELNDSILESESI